MRKIIFLDVDGTLVDYHNRIPESAIRAIRQARENGHLVYVCTGRSRAEMQPELWEIGLDGMIGGNGSYVEHQDQVIMHQLLSEEDSRAIVDWLHERGLEFYLESNNGLFASENFRERARETLRIYSMNKGKTAEEVATQEVEDVMHGMIFDGQLYRNDLNKVSFVLDSYQDHLDSKQAFPQLVANTWGGRGESALFGDLGVKDIDKAHAISVLLNHLGASQADSIAFGDAKIDISMLDYCAVGVAMGNGGAEILAMADMITDDVEEDGLYNAFEKLGLLASSSQNKS
ncbi:Cof-type HAD-IIB family hydrolase [Streptococcus suis]|uniref:Cof-type HAD-IIB family hydrolase n=1 Tax=Streptococcus suis TaxID=1307 RepID=UPI00040B9AA0|nr:Cof-type HAD-IIB family hydrolase [Streptococcus suis]MCE6986907.1 Cof-type HAD-IIB family hydrolase [Streptococcus suis]NQI45297.1 Cof-type HAD-IIB family hydrolase [Streptococcus suis]NQJ75643.1 Cof-type HAD-IIB family hydrolase [Streptococcus suis]NQJ79839.1 Cof-type HAD-IIB family hydrolase [Streptococcus suis]NQK11349.1 Cof-type HAD-IIB family hydrolase [Streptococcus suis]